MPEIFRHFHDFPVDRDIWFKLEGHQSAGNFPALPVDGDMVQTGSRVTKVPENFRHFQWMVTWFKLEGHQRAGNFPAP